jgi:hypothetical protein
MGRLRAGGPLTRDSRYRGTPGALSSRNVTSIWRRTSSTSSRVATDAASGRSGVPVSPAAIRRAASTAVTNSPSCPIAGSV